METQQANGTFFDKDYLTDIPGGSKLAKMVAFYKPKLDALFAKIENFQGIPSDQEVDLLWLYRADKLWDDGKFDKEIETFKYDVKPKKKYDRRAGAKTNGTRKRKAPARLISK